MKATKYSLKEMAAKYAGWRVDLLGGARAYPSPGAIV
jgi:hypothetical protein